MGAKSGQDVKSPFSQDSASVREPKETVRVKNQDSFRDQPPADRDSD
jgi:hypothetical protein